MKYKCINQAVGSALAMIALGLCTAQSASACSRVLWNDNQQAVLIGRTMDWPESTEPVLTVLPRGMKRDGGRLGGEQVIKENSLSWTSKYGSMVTSIYGIAAADGFNERGLAAHMLFFKISDFGPRDTSKKAINGATWAQYVLDNAATVIEALALLENVQIVLAEARGTKTTVHLAIEDASGDSAIIEYLNGKQTVHHGREFKIMTNDPAYDEHLALLKKQDFSKPSSEMPLPGNVNASDRFLRASYYLPMLPEPKTEREAVASMLGIIRNVSVPFGAPYKDFGVYNTEYRTVTDLSHKRYYFEFTTSPNVIWADLAKFKLTAGAPVMVLNPDNINLSGDVSGKFKKAAKVPF
ncbi:MAG: linear amide C-N hydrolase [Methylococcales bacterium]|nr:linear amide C-N hydrolase [Methylococcales bacterium]